MIWSSFGVSFVSKSWEKLLEAWSWLYAPKYRSHRRASMGLDWIFRQPTEKSSGLFWTRAEPVPNPYFTRANPNFWHKYIVFFQNTMFLKRVLNPCQTRTLPVQTRTICSGSEGSRLCHFCCNVSTDSYENRHRIGIIGGWCWLSMLSTGQEGAEEPPRVSQPHVCWGLWPRMLEYAGIGWLYSFLSSPSKLQIWKHRVLWKNLVFFSYPTFL